MSRVYPEVDHIAKEGFTKTDLMNLYDKFSKSIAAGKSIIGKRFRGGDLGPVQVEFDSENNIILFMPYCRFRANSNGEVFEFLSDNGARIDKDQAVKDASFLANTSKDLVKLLNALPTLEEEARAASSATAALPKMTTTPTTPKVDGLVLRGRASAARLGIYPEGRGGK